MNSQTCPGVVPIPRSQQAYAKLQKEKDALTAKVTNLEGRVEFLTKAKDEDGKKLTGADAQRKADLEARDKDLAAERATTAALRQVRGRAVRTVLWWGCVCVGGGGTGLVIVHCCTSVLR